jgi:hypothetical protein
MLSTIEKARRYVSKCPIAISGQNGHGATFHVAATLVWGFALGEMEALRLLREWNQSCVPPWSERDLVYKVRSAAAAKHNHPRGYLLRKNVSTSPWPSPPTESVMARPKPEFSPEVLKRIAAKTSAIGDVVASIMDRSPVVVETQDSASVLRRLYPFGSGEKILIFSTMESQGQMLWEADKSDVIQNRHLPVGEEGVWFLPQPVDGDYHPNPRMDNKPSRRSEEAILDWRFAVPESDEADADDWLRCLIQLPLRIACICESGGRSIHALVRVEAASKAEWDKMIGSAKPLLITLGADRGALSAVRLTRLPQSQRGQRIQRLIYLNPKPVGGVPILEQPCGCERVRDD